MAQEGMRKRGHSHDIAQAPAMGPGEAQKQRIVDGLYRSCWTELCSWLRWRFGPGPPEPEDVAQIAFGQISEVTDISVIRNPRAFLYTIAARTAVSAYRSRSVTQRFIDREMHENGLEVEEITPERVYQGREQLRTVEQGLAELTDMQHEIVIRCRVLGQTYAQISSETGWSLASISRQLQAALITISRRVAPSGKSESSR